MFQHYLRSIRMVEVNFDRSLNSCMRRCELSKGSSALGAGGFVETLYNLRKGHGQRQQEESQVQGLKEGHSDFSLKGYFDDCLPPCPAACGRWRVPSTRTGSPSTTCTCWATSSSRWRSFAVELVWDNRFRGSVPFLPFFTRCAVHHAQEVDWTGDGRSGKKQKESIVTENFSISHLTSRSICT